MSGVQLTVVKEDRDWRTTPSTVTQTKQVVQADTLDELFTAYFRDYDNRYKYCNDLRISILEVDMHDRYYEWIGDMGNYIKAGGDMW